MFFPGQARRGALCVAPPFGTARIKAVVCSRPLQFSGMLSAAQARAAQPPASNAPSAAFPDLAGQPAQRAVVGRPPGCQQENPLAADEHDPIEPRRILGRFAQDEVAFYIGPQERSITP